MSGPNDPQAAFERIVSLARGPKGDRGERGDTGTRGERGLSRVQGRAVIFLFLIAVTLAVFAIFWVSHAVNSATAAQQRQEAATAAQQRRQGQIIEQKICTTLGRLAALTPPPGTTAGDPSRAYEQQQHETLAELGPDLGCG